MQILSLATGFTSASLPWPKVEGACAFNIGLNFIRLACMVLWELAIRQ